MIVLKKKITKGTTGLAVLFLIKRHLFAKPEGHTFLISDAELAALERKVQEKNSFLKKKGVLLVSIEGSVQDEIYLFCEQALREKLAAETIDNPEHS